MEVVREAWWAVRNEFNTPRLERARSPHCATVPDIGTGQGSKLESGIAESSEEQVQPSVSTQSQRRKMVQQKQRRGLGGNRLSFLRARICYSFFDLPLIYSLPVERSSYPAGPGWQQDHLCPSNLKGTTQAGEKGNKSLPQSFSAFLNFSYAHID